MAFLIAYLPGVSYNRKQFIGANATDLPVIENFIDITPGSEVLVPTERLRFILNSQYVWSSAPYHSTEGGGGSGGGDTYTNLTPVTTALGGIKAGETFNSQTLQQMFDRLLYPIRNPSLTNPSGPLTLLSARYVEIGAVSDVRVRTNFNRGSISPAYGTSGFRSGLPNQYRYDGGGLGPVADTTLTNSQTVAGYMFNAPGHLDIKVQVAYDAGEQPLNSEGAPYNSPLPAGTTTESSIRVTGVYPIYAKTVNNTTMTVQPLTDAKTLSYNFAGESADPNSKQAFQWHQSTGTLRGVQMFNIITNAWEYLGGSAANSILQFTETDIIVTTASGDEPYKLYTHNRGQIGARELRIEIN